MSELSVDKKINSFIAEHSDLKSLPKAQVISIMLKQNKLTQTEAKTWFNQLEKSANNTPEKFKSGESAVNKLAIFGGTKKTKTIVENFTEADLAYGGMGIVLERKSQVAEVGAVAVAKRNNINDFGGGGNSDLSLSREESQNRTLTKLTQTVALADNLFKSQKNNQGQITQVYDLCKDLSKSDLSSGKLKQAITLERLGLTYLTQAQSNTLTKREYYEHVKEDLLLMTPGIHSMSEASKQNYTKRISSLTIEEVKFMQKQLQNLPKEDSPEYKAQAQKYMNNFKSMTEQSPTLERTGDVEVQGMQAKSKDSIMPPVNYSDGDEPIKFEEVFAYERGINFDASKVAKFEVSQKMLQVLEEKNEKVKKIHSYLDKPLANPRNDWQATDIVKVEMGLKLALKEMYGEDETAVSEGLKKLLGDDIPTDPIMLSKSVLQKLDKNFNTMLNGKSMDDYRQDYAESYVDAFGKKNSEQLAKAYAEDNESIDEQISSTIQMGGMGMMMLGGAAFLIPGAQAFGGAMLSWGGKMAMGGMVAQTALSAYNENSKPNGMSDEAESRIVKEGLLNLGCFITGAGAGIKGAKVGANMLANGSSKFTALMAERGTDLALSVAGDMLLMGDVSVEGNLLGQVTATLTGLKTGKTIAKHIPEQKMAEPALTKPNSKVVERFEVPLEKPLKTEEVRVPEPEIKPNLDEIVKVDNEVKPSPETVKENKANNHEGYAVNRADDEDLKVIQKIDLEAFNSTDPVARNFESFKAQIIADELDSYVIKDADKKVVGYYQLEPIVDGELYINSIGVPKELRNTKASYAALQQMQKDIRKKAIEEGVERVTLHVDASNKMLLKLYKKFGFEIKETERNYFENGDDAYYMEADVKKILAKENQSKSPVIEPEVKIVEEIKEPIEIKAIKEVKEDNNILLDKSADEIPLAEPVVTSPKVEEIKIKEQAVIPIKQETPANIYSKDEFKIEGTLNETTPVMAETSASLREVLVSTGMIADDKINKFLENIPNEHCAKVLQKYAEKFKDYDDIDYIALYRNPEAIQEFVKILEDPELNTVKPSLIRNLRSYSHEEYKDLAATGVFSEYRNVDFQEIQAIQKIENPEKRALVAKLYGSKLFSVVPFHKLYNPFEDLNPKNLQRIDDMCDTFKWGDSMDEYDAYNIVNLPDSKLDIIEQRGLLKRFQDRAKRLSGSDVRKLVEAEEAKWTAIQERGLLKDVEGRDDYFFGNGLKGEEMIELASLSDVEWKNLQDKNLLTMEVERKPNSSISNKYISSENAVGIAKFSEEQYEEFKGLSGMQDEAGKKRFSIDECIELTKATDEIKARIKSQDLLNAKRDDELLSYYDIMERAKVNEDEKALMENYLGMQTSTGKSMFSTYEVKVLAEMTPEELANAKKRGLFDEFERIYDKNATYSGYDIVELSRVSDKTWANMEKSGLKYESVTYEYLNLKEMTDKQWERAFEELLPNDKHPKRIMPTVNEVIKCTALEDANWERYKTDILPSKNKFTVGVSLDKINDITSLDEKQYNRFIDVMCKLGWDINLSDVDLIDLTSLDDKSWNRFKDELFYLPDRDKQLSCYEIKSLLELDDKTYKIAKENFLNTKGRKNEDSFSINRAIELAKGSEAQLKKSQELMYVEQRGNQQLSLDMINKISNLTDEQYARVKNDLLYVEQRGIPYNQLSGDAILKFAQLPQDKYDLAKKLVYNPVRGENQLDKDVISKILDLNAETFNKIKEFLCLENDKKYQISFSQYTLKEFLDLDEKAIQRIKDDVIPFSLKQEQYHHINSSSDIAELVSLPDENYNNLKKHVFDNEKMKNRFYGSSFSFLKDFSAEDFAKVEKDLLHIEALGYSQLGATDMKKLINMPEENYNRFITDLVKIKSSSSDTESLIKLAELNEECYKRVKEDLLHVEGRNSQFDSKQLLALAQLDDVTYDRMKEFLYIDGAKGQISAGELCKFGQFLPDQFAKIKDMIPNLTHWSVEDMIKLADMTDSQKAIFNKRHLLDKNSEYLSELNIYQLTTLSNLDDNQFKKIEDTIDYFKKNIDLLQHHDTHVKPEMITLLVASSCDGVLGIDKIVGEQVLKHSVGMKYNGLQQFFSDANSLRNVDENMQIMIKNKLEKLSHPEQKLEKLQVLLSLANKRLNDSVYNVANSIKSPSVTNNQAELTNKIFATDKPYSEQIEDFIKEFNVPQERQDIIRKFLTEQKVNEKYVTPPSIDEQIAVINKKAESIKSNDKIPADKKSAYLNQLEKQKQDIIANPSIYSEARINDRVMKPLEAQIEAHINTINNNKEFNKNLNIEIYKILKIEADDDLLNNIKYDNKYFGKLFSGISKEGFKENFNKLINLIKANPNKKFSEIIEQIPENQETRKLFEENGLNYDKWINFDKDSHKDFVVNVNIVEAANSARQSLIEEFKSDLFKNLDATQTDKLSKILLDMKVDSATKKELPQIIEVIEKEFKENEYWKQTEPNIQTFKDHINIHKKNIKSLEYVKDSKEELSVRLWDNDDVGRNIFFGNHVGCCTSVGSFNSFAAPQHLMNSFVRGIEIVDKSGTSMGNSMCYFAKVDGKVTFVIDSFEANGKLGGAPMVTDAIIDYAKQVCKEMGQPDANIMFGPNYNKISFQRCMKTGEHTIEVLGRVPEDTYIDSIGGKGNVNVVNSGLSMHEIVDL